MSCKKTSKEALSSENEKLKLKNFVNQALLKQLEAIEQTHKDEVALVKKQLEESNSRFSSLESHITDTMTRVSANTTKQLESFISLQNYLISESQLLNFHGWPISPDIALFLVQKIEENNYDLVIEFGSGTSTLLMSKVLKQRALKSPEHPSPRLVTFEHNEKYFNQTLQALKQQSTEDQVDLVYAPLEPFSFEDETFSYYSCKEKFQALREALENKTQKVLVLVDGPPGATGPLARFPVLPYLLTSFPDQQIHMVLDDYDRADEKAIVKKWEELLEEKSIAFQSESIPSEKGLYFCQIN